MANHADDDANPASQTLLCGDPFEVLRLLPGCFHPDEIKRQYRRLALLLHPDKNRHRAFSSMKRAYALKDAIQEHHETLASLVNNLDAEAAFKKLTAAFEKLHDPVQQAACRVEAEQRARRKAREDPPPPKPDGFTPGDGAAGSTSRGWCREGEAASETKRKEPAPSVEKRKEQLQDFEKEERVFKEQVAEAKVRTAEKKRVKAEERARADQARIDKLRDAVLGSEEDGAVEAKTASWQKFSAITSKRKASHGKPNVKASRRSTPVQQRSSEASESGDSGANPSQVQCGDPMSGSGMNHVREKDDETQLQSTGKATEFVCWVCRRSFRSASGLTNHESKSELHMINIQLQELLTPRQAHAS